MIRISITAAAYDAIARSYTPLGTFAVDRKTNEKGEREIWLEPLRGLAIALAT